MNQLRGTPLKRFLRDFKRAHPVTHDLVLVLQSVMYPVNVGSLFRIADSVGFGFRYDPEQDQYAHPAVATFLSPRGKISRYVYGLEFDQRDLKFALMEASEGKVGSTVDKLILSCFHYDASTGRYGAWAFGIMRLGGAVTMLLLGAFLVLLWRRERHRRPPKGEHAREGSEQEVV